MINMPPSAGFSAVIEYDSIAVIETNPNRVSVLLIVPSSVILSDATPPWKYCGFSAGCHCGIPCESLSDSSTPLSILRVCCHQLVADTTLQVVLRSIQNLGILDLFRSPSRELLKSIPSLVTSAVPSSTGIPRLIFRRASDFRNSTDLNLFILLQVQ